jgi:hypothetical protein
VFCVDVAAGGVGGDCGPLGFVLAFFLFWLSLL